MGLQMEVGGFLRGHVSPDRGGETRVEAMCLLTEVGGGGGAIQEAMCLLNRGGGGGGLRSHVSLYAYN